MGRLGLFGMNSVNGCDMHHTNVVYNALKDCELLQDARELELDGDAHRMFGEPTRGSMGTVNRSSRFKGEMSTPGKAL